MVVTRLNVSSRLIIDLGLEGGAGGGQIIAEGRPEQVAKIAGSRTGRLLTNALARASSID